MRTIGLNEAYDDSMKKLNRSSLLQINDHSLFLKKEGTWRKKKRKENARAREEEREREGEKNQGKEQVLPS